MFDVNSGGKGGSEGLVDAQKQGENGECQVKKDE